MAKGCATPVAYLAAGRYSFTILKQCNILLLHPMHPC
jgi:hypothetical protein